MIVRNKTGSREHEKRGLVKSLEFLYPILIIGNAEIISLLNILDTALLCNQIINILMRKYLLSVIEDTFLASTLETFNNGDKLWLPYIDYALCLGSFFTWSIRG